MACIVEQIVTEVTTIGSTPLVVSTYTVPAGSIATITADVIARTSGGTRATWNLYGSAGREAGAASLISAVLDLVSPRRDLGAALWSAAVQLSGNDLVVQVTGQVGTTISWLVVTRIIVYTPS